jgi:hypothetical protein
LIENDAGEVALTYYQPTQVLISGNRTATGRDYVFVTQFKGVCMAWVDPADVPRLLEMRGGCCGKRKQMFTYANDAQVSIWTGGDGRQFVEERRGCGC